MNYLKIYDKLIKTAKQRNKSEGYFELHHILPRCLGGSNEKDNLVMLKAREHFVAHKLLVKIHSDNAKLLFALEMLKVISPTHNGNRTSGILSSRLYERLSISKSEKMKIDNPMKNPSVKQKMLETRKKRKEDGKHKIRVVTAEEKERASKRMKISNPMKNRDTVEKAKASVKKLYSSGQKKRPKMSNEQRKKHSERMKLNNPMKNPETVRKSMESHTEEFRLALINRMKDNNPNKNPDTIAKANESRKRNFDNGLRKKPIISDELRKSRSEHMKLNNPMKNPEIAEKSNSVNKRRNK